MTKRLADKVAVITGAAAGMGRVTAELFVAEGARVVLADIQADKVRALAKDLGANARGIGCDVTSEADVQAAVALAESEFGGLDILFNNAGVPGSADPIDRISNRDWDQIMSVLLRSVLFGIRHAVPAMRARGGGSIVNTGSTAGVRAGYGNAAYAVAKAGVSHLGRMAASELASDGIRVNTILPGFIATSIFGAVMGADPDTADRLAPGLHDDFAKFQPLRRPGLPSDIAEACVYLASDASRFVTGIELVVDGGLFLQGPPQLEPGGATPLTAMLQSIAREVAAQ